MGLWGDEGQRRMDGGVQRGPGEGVQKRGGGVGGVEGTYTEAEQAMAVICSSVVLIPSHSRATHAECPLDPPLNGTNTPSPPSSPRRSLPPTPLLGPEHAAAAGLLTSVAADLAQNVESMRLTHLEAELQQQKPATLLQQHALDQDSGGGGRGAARVGGRGSGGPQAHHLKQENKLVGGHKTHQQQFVTACAFKLVMWSSLGRVLSLDPRSVQYHKQSNSMPAWLLTLIKGFTKVSV